MQMNLRSKKLFSLQPVVEHAIATISIIQRSNENSFLLRKFICIIILLFHIFPQNAGARSVWIEELLFGYFDLVRGASAFSGNYPMACLKLWRLIRCTAICTSRRRARTGIAPVSPNKKFIS